MNPSSLMRNVQIWQAQQQNNSRLGAQSNVPIYSKEAYKMKFKKNRQYDILGENIDAFITS
jgi:hypothetical protein